MLAASKLYLSIVSSLPQCLADNLLRTRNPRLFLFVPNSILNQRSAAPIGDGVKIGNPQGCLWISNSDKDFRIDWAINVGVCQPYYGGRFRCGWVRQSHGR